LVPLGRLGEVGDHLVDVVLQLADLAGGVDGDHPREVALRHGRGHLGDRTHLRRQIPGQLVDVLGQAGPRAADALDLRLAAELPFRADLPGHPGDLGGEGRQLVDHLVDGGLQLEDLPPGVDGDVLRQVALGHGGGDLGDVADLVGEVVGHGVHRVGEVLPHAGDAGHGRLAAELPLGADLAGDPGDVGGPGRQLVDHRVDGVLELQQLAPQLDGDLAGQVAPGHGRRHLGDVADLVGEVGGQQVDVVGQVLPRAAHAGDDGLAAEAALGADLPGHPGDLVGEAPQLVDHRVDGLLQLGHLAPGLDGDLLRQVALGHGGGDLGDIADLARQVGGELVDVVGQVLPRAEHAGHLGLAAEAALGANLPGHPGDLVGEAPQLVDHRVDGVLQLRHLTGGVDGDLLGEVALGDGGGDLGDVADLARQVPGQLVDVVGQRLPRARHSGHVGLPAELAVGSDLPGDAGDLVGEAGELVDHRVDGVLQLGHLAPGLDGDLLRQVAPGHGLGHLGDVADLAGEVAGEL